MTKSFKAYGKVDSLEKQALKRRNRRKMIILLLSLVVLVALIIGIVVGTLNHKKNKNGDDALSSTPNSAQSIKAVCSVATYPKSCYSSLSPFGTSNSTIDPEKLFHLSLQVVHDSLEKLSTLPQEWINNTDDPEVKKALGVCQTVFDEAVDAVNESILSLNVIDSNKVFSVKRIHDLKTWLSTSLTDLETCLDTLEEVNATILEDVRTSMKNSTEFASNSLAIVSKLVEILSDFQIPVNRKLLGETGRSSGFPHWVRAADRRLLQTSKDPQPNLVVALDGSGDYRTINEAVARIPINSKTRFVIYVKAGVYKEKVILDKPLWNVMMYGDGKTETIVTFDDNYVDGTRTFDTPTFAVTGKNFIAKNMGFKNTAGPEKEQAVAVRSGSDRSVFHQCSFDGFQDTLYSHTNRQFYSKCDIIGTVDFIFGNAAVVFQDCNILPRQPLPDQFVTITAQGKKDRNQNTGISIQSCVVTPLDNVTVPVFLGRPWKNYSTTIIMQTKIGGLLSPVGWIEWFRNVEPPSTIFYAEYQNTGAGASVANRVKWAGYRPTLTPKQASNFAIGPFLDGQDWIPASQVTFT
ncbi:pectinesterase 3-like [Coffea eugenioides]|uniref:pectinesterase 3-like n=1 Tax=Coffea eugenioides TaxID=49369 RepID=UPI000F61544E|nr:pectinesterase 3-like [Coffea eugenioides]